MRTPSPSRPARRLLIDLGDDTSNGGSWETFSINSLAREFRGFSIVAVAGNHDQGSSVTDTMKDRGFRVLTGRPVDVDGIRFLGSSDPRSSGFTAGYDGEESDNIKAIEEQDQRLTEVACQDERVDVLVVHSAASARKASESGCVDLVLSGHLHRQVGPDVDRGGERPLHHHADDRLDRRCRLHVRAGQQAASRRPGHDRDVPRRRPVGLQPVTFEPGGIIEVGDFTRVRTSSR